MPAHSLKVDWEAIRVLALSHGLETAAQQSGINLNAIKARSARKNWFARDAGTIATNATKAGDAHLDIMAERKRESATHLSRYIVDASEKLSQSKGNLKLAKVGRDVVAMRSGTWPEEQGQAGFSLNVLNLGQLQIGIRTDSETDTSA